MPRIHHAKILNCQQPRKGQNNLPYITTTRTYTTHIQQDPSLYYYYQNIHNSHTTGPFLILLLPEHTQLTYNRTLPYITTTRIYTTHIQQDPSLYYYYQNIHNSHTTGPFLILLLPEHTQLTYNRTLPYITTTSTPMQANISLDNW